MGKRIVTSCFLALSLAWPAMAAAANEITQGICSADPAHCNQTTTNLFGKGGTFVTVADLLIFIVAAASVLMIIVGGLRYTLSGGNPSATAGAKDTILYAIIGVVVSLLAFAAVSWVTGQFK